MSYTIYTSYNECDDYNTYQKWYEAYYEHNMNLFKNLIKTVKKYNLPIKSGKDINKNFDFFCEMIYKNSSKRIDNYL